MRGQQHWILTHEQVFLWKCQSFWNRKCLDLRGTRPPTFGCMPNALTYWAIRATQLLSHILNTSSGGIYIFAVRLTFNMLTVHGQHYSISTQELVFLWKCQRFWDRKCLDLLGTGTHNLITHVGNNYEVERIVIENDSPLWENLFVSIKGARHNKDIVVGNIYIGLFKDNYNIENINAFTSDIENAILELNRKNSQMVIAGDYNINLLNLDVRQAFRDFFIPCCPIAFP